MDRRQFAVSLPIAGLLIGCDSDPKPAPPSTSTKPEAAQPSTLVSNTEVQDALKAHELAIINLEVNADRLGDESWLDVVPDVEGAARDVRTSFAALQKVLAAANF